MTEKETPKILRIDKMLVLYEDGRNVTLLGDKPLRWKVIPDDEQFVRILLLMIACRGDEAVMMKVSPDHIYQVTEEEFDKVLRRFGGDIAAEQFRAAALKSE